MKLIQIPTIFRNFFVNIRALFKYNLEDDAIKKLDKETDPLRQNKCASKKDLIELFFSQNPSELLPFQKEMLFLREYGIIDAFPYKQLKKLNQVTCGFDSEKKLPFVIHQGKKLYFPLDWSISHIEEIYRNYIERENLLGGEYTEKAPHQYTTQSFQLEENEILVDIGCAEALFSLDSIELAKHVYLFECDKKWKEPLEATFSNYKNKVTIILKKIGDKDSEQSTSLQSFFNDFRGESFFIKMDIEGSEEKAIMSSLDFLTSKNNFKLACCTYHRANHAKNISQKLMEIGYNVHFSDGYMLYFNDNNQIPPYFRRGLIRASFQNT